VDHLPQELRFDLICELIMPCPRTNVTRPSYSCLHTEAKDVSPGNRRSAIPPTFEPSFRENTNSASFLSMTSCLQLAKSSPFSSNPYTSFCSHREYHYCVNNCSRTASITSFGLVKLSEPSLLQIYCHCPAFIKVSMPSRRGESVKSLEVECGSYVKAVDIHMYVHAV